MLCMLSWWHPAVPLFHYHVLVVLIHWCVTHKGLPMMEIQKLVREQKENLTNPVTQADFLEAIKKVKGSVSETDLERYTKWMEEYGAN